MNTEKIQAYAPAVLRIGVSLVYLWFGFQQFLNTKQWISYIPKSVIAFSPVDAETLVHFNGAIEIVFGFALLVGIFSGISALILALHMADITYVVGYDAIGVRDFGITIATFAAALYGADVLSLESYLSFRKTYREEIPIPTKIMPTIAPVVAVVKNNHTIEAMVQYIKQEKIKGTPVSNIRDSLFVKGWSIAEIDSAYQSAKQEINT
jgi:uncharacterized membrane protein YphA (DoxX/SURF4 family)